MPAHSCSHCGYTNYAPPSQAQIWCLNCGSLYYAVPPVPIPEPTTQKAKGLKLLKALSNAVGVVLPIEYLFPVKGDHKIDQKILDMLPNGYFARPCPPTAEHGFVESKVISSIEELAEMKEATLAVNENSEIMLTVPIDAKFNCVWTPRLISIGAGHDGATSGKNTFSFPLAGISPFNEHDLLSAGIDDTKGPYVEAVMGTPKRQVPGLYIPTYGHNASPWIATQLRCGPKVKSIALDFVPCETVVGNIRKTNGEDLLAWAKVVKQIAADNANAAAPTVVYHPGGTPVDHYSVHCRENGVAILTTREAAIGEVLSPVGEVTAYDPHQMSLGIAAMNEFNPTCNQQAGNFTKLALAALHHSSVMRGEHSFYIGVAAATILKLGCAALEGEARHAHNCYAGMKEKPNIYGWYAGKSISFLRARLSRITQLLRYGWGAEGEIGKTGFGGLKWAWCGAALCPLFNAVRDLVVDPTEEHASNLTQALNIAINQAHNGGWWLNKFCDETVYTHIPKGYIPYTADAALAAKIISEKRKTAEVDLVKLLKQVLPWPETTIRPLAFRKASLEIGMGSFVLNLKASTVPTPRQIIIPTTSSFVKKLLTSAKGGVEINSGRIELVTPDGERQAVWQEDPLEIISRDPANMK